MRTWPLMSFIVGAAFASASAQPVDSPVNRMWSRYFASETHRLAGQCLAEIQTREDWDRRAPDYRRQLREMLGLDPWPERTSLQPVVTATTEHEEFTVERLHFQSSPGLYVTGNLYVPRQRPGRLPAILYVSGHGPVKKNGISYGNKVSYQHHGAWFARHGYVCLIIDTIQMGEIEGIHHGTYREGMWWWNSRGYTPAGVEAWNSIRAIDYLQSRPEVDPERIGMTGRSGGGAYSWWTAAIDERVKAVAPVAGITDLHNHVIDGTVEGHCDCMFMINTYQWDYAQVAALVAPRPLLIGNTDRDSIFPLDGVVRLHRQVTGIYKLLNAETNLALLITEGPHHDTQDLQVPVMRWFNRFLKDNDPLIRVAAEKLFEPEQLKVFATLPADQRVTTIHESFVPAATPPALPANAAEWQRTTRRLQSDLRAKTFAAWPTGNTSVAATEVLNHRSGAVRLRRLDIETQPGMTLPLVVLEPRGRSTAIELRVVGHADWQAAMATLQAGHLVSGQVSTVTNLNEAVTPTADATVPEVLDRTLVFFAPRGAGLTAPELNARGFIQFRRRFMMLGQTLDGMRVWDIRQAVQALDREFDLQRRPLTLQATGSMAVNTLVACLFESPRIGLHLDSLPASLRDGPDYLSAARITDLPTLVAAASIGRGGRSEFPHAPDGLLEFRNQVARHLGSSASR